MGKRNASVDANGGASNKKAKAGMFNAMNAAATTPVQKSTSSTSSSPSKKVKKTGKK